MKQTEFVIKSSAKGNDADDTYENDMMCDYDYYGDTRKRRVVMEQDPWTNQCTNCKDRKRIYYIKKKKEMKKSEQMQKNKGDYIEEEEDYKKSKKRQLKENNRNVEDDAMSIDNKAEGKKKRKEGKTLII